MGAFTFNIISGQRLFTASLTPAVVPPLTNLSLGYHSFTGVPQDIYTLTITDAWGCIYTTPVDLSFLECSDTNIFKYAISSIVVGNNMYIGERNIDPYIVRFNNIDNLDSYIRTSVTGVGDIAVGLESVCYSGVHNRLYFSARDNATGCLAIIETHPTSLVYTKHVIIGISGSMFVIATDDTYIYGGSDTEFFKIRISDWSIIQTQVFAGFADSGAIAINTSKSQFYISSSGATSNLAIVSTNDVSSYNIVDISTYVSHPSDDLCYYNNEVYVAGEYNIVGWGAAQVNVDTLAVTGIELSPSYGLWAYCTKIYNASSDELIEVFDVSDPSFITTYDIEEVGFAPNEILFVGERMFITKWGTTGVAKLCEYICIDINCTTTTTTSTSSSTTTTTTLFPPTTTTTTTGEPEPTTTTTTSSTSTSTTTTTTTCYNLVEYPCGMYNIYNYTDEYRDIETRNCYTEIWFTGISVGPHSVYKLAECKEVRTTDCELVFELVEICTTTTTTTCPCDFSELIISDSETYDAVANTYGTYCTESGKRYNCQIFDLGGAAYIKRVGILGGKPVGSPNITMRALILDTHLWGGRVSVCGDVPPCPIVTPAAFPDHDLAWSTNSITFTEDNPETPQWYYFCFDNYYYDPAAHTNGDYPAGSPPAVAFVFTVNGVNGNTASNYVQFCTDTDPYANGRYAYKINDLLSCAWGMPLVNYNLSCRICYESDSTTTTTTTVPPTTTTTTSSSSTTTTTTTNYCDTLENTSIWYGVKIDGTGYNTTSTYESAEQGVCDFISQEKGVTLLIGHSQRMPNIPPEVGDIIYTTVGGGCNLTFAGYYSWLAGPGDGGTNIEDWWILQVNSNGEIIQIFNTLTCPTTTTTTTTTP